MKIYKQQDVMVVQQDNAIVDKSPTLKSLCGLCVSDRHAHAFLSRNGKELILWHRATKNVEKSIYWYGIRLNNVDKYTDMYPNIDVYIALLFNNEKRGLAHEVLMIPLTKFFEWGIEPDNQDRKLNFQIQEVEDMLNGGFLYYLKQNGADVTKYKIENYDANFGTIGEVENMKKDLQLSVDLEEGNMKKDLRLFVDITEFEEELAPIIGSIIVNNKNKIVEQQNVETNDNIITGLQDKEDSLLHELETVKLKKESAKLVKEDSIRKFNIYSEEEEKGRKALSSVFENRQKEILLKIEKLAKDKGKDIISENKNPQICGQ